MSREIRFRAWDKERKEMLYPRQVYSFPSNYEHKLDLMQYTGLCDKNGKEIYEGDIILVLDRDWPSGDYSNQTPEQYMRSIASVCKVIFKNAEFILSQIKGHGYFYDSIYCSRGRDIYEIIGNIHENPELLNDK